MNGAWFVFTSEGYGDARPVALFGEEVDALRFIIERGYGYTVFWEFGKKWDEVDA